MKMGIPDRWLPYSAIGKLIAGTRFIAFKVPLSEDLNKRLKEQERFSPALLMKLCPKLSLVVDLTNTKRYYNKNVFTSKAIAHEKLFCPGRQVPHDSLAKRFNEIVDAFLRTNGDTDGLIGVHCTHGVNRTGYFICRYMIERMGMTPESAVKAFQEARGHVIERGNYVDDLKNGCRGGPNLNNSKQSNKRKAERKPHNGDGVNKMETKKKSLNTQNNKTNDWHNYNNNYNVYQRDPCVNSGIDYGYDTPMSSGYGQSNRGRYGNQRGNYERGFGQRHYQSRGNPVRGKYGNQHRLVDDEEKNKYTKNMGELYIQTKPNIEKHSTKIDHNTTETNWRIANK